MRKEGWEKILDNFIHENAGREFSYGAFDCVIFASDAVLAITGIDPIYEGRGEYTTLREGHKIVKRLRGDYAGIMDFHFERLRSPKRAQRGDVVLRDLEADTTHEGATGGPAFGVVGNGGKAWFVGVKGGLVQFPLRDCKTAWRVE